MFRRLRQYASAGWALWISAKLYHDWGIVVSFLVGISASALALGEWGTQFGYTPIVLVLLFTAAVMIWIINGVLALLRRGVPTNAKISFDYAYGLALQRIDMNRDDADEPPIFSSVLCGKMRRRRP